MNIRRLALSAFAASLIAATLTFAPGASAHDLHPGLNFVISVDGVDGCNTRQGDVACEVPVGTPFVLEVHLDRLPDEIPSYGGFDIFLEYDGVHPLEDADTSNWPDCAFPASFYSGPDFFHSEGPYVAIGCALGVPPAGPSTYFGAIARNSFVCDAPGFITLAHGADEGLTDLVEPSLAKHAEGAGTRETLYISCGASFMPTPAATATPSGQPGLPHTGQGPMEQTWPSLIFVAAFGAAVFSIAAFLRSA